MQGIVEYQQCIFVVGFAQCLDLAETEQEIGSAQDQYYLLQEVALLQVVGLEAVFVGYQNFGQAIVEAPSIGYFAANFFVVVAIDFAGFAIGFFVSQATSYFVGQATGCFASQATSCFASFARKVGSTEKDSTSFGFTIDYCKDLKIVKDLEAYLVLKPMVDIE